MSHNDRQPCPKCGALNYVADDICVSCGYDLPPVGKPAPPAPDEGATAEPGLEPDGRSEVETRGAGEPAPPEPDSPAAAPNTPDVEALLPEGDPTETEDCQPSSQPKHPLLRLQGGVGCSCAGAAVGCIVPFALLVLAFSGAFGALDMALGPPAIPYFCGMGAAAGGLVGGLVWALIAGCSKFADWLRSPHPRPVRRSACLWWSLAGAAVGVVVWLVVLPTMGAASPSARMEERLWWAIVACVFGGALLGASVWLLWAGVSKLSDWFASLRETPAAEERRQRLRQRMGIVHSVAARAQTRGRRVARRRLAIAAVVCVLGLGAVGWLIWSRTRGPEPLPALSLLAEFETDPEAADVKYNGRTITVSGNVWRIKREGEFPYFVPPAVLLDERIWCHFPRGEVPPVFVKLRPGDGIIIRGRMSVRFASRRAIILTGCEIVSVE
jgi:hypothetical protein